ncbi:hypothetical protein [Leclercia sp.]|uniref:phage head spike fiber domain-containing protein n=1 Tax=Leclercia sp. TaxID=1898428 RepID=UPI00289C6999|nr:hypothetical protein [Leclercia sp.]
MATLDDDLAKAVTEGFRLAQNDIINQDLILSGSGDVTVTLADGSKKTGPSWSKLITAANAAGTSAAAAATSATNAKTSETNANSSKTAAATSATNAKTSETNAKTSETNAKTSETNAKTSENNASASASSAAASLAAAQLLTSVPYEAAPFPDVWAPLNDDLRLLAGFAPYDTLTISGQVLELPSKSMTFTRNSTATYIDKSGVLKTAANNEPRFERDGLLMEGQSTNYFLNSDDPTKWAGKAASLTTSVLNDGTTQAVTLKGTCSALVTSLIIIQGSTLALVDGEAFTVSARFKGSYGKLRFRIVKDSSFFGDANFSFSTGQLVGSVTGGLTVTTATGSDGYSYATMTLTSAVAGNYVVQIYAMPEGSDTNIPVGSEFYIQTVQLEKNAVATSYIPTGAAAATRAKESLTLTPACNIGYNAVGDLFNRTVSFEISVSQYMNPVGYTYFRMFQAYGASYDIFMQLHNGYISSYRSGANTSPVISTAYPFSRRIFTQTIDANNKLTAYFNDQVGSRTGPPNNLTGIPSNIVADSNSSVVYHLRNFRIWHRLLTPNQINGLR